MADGDQYPPDDSLAFLMGRKPMPVPPPTVFIQLHGPANNPVYFRQSDVVAVMDQHGETLIYLSNGQQWTVKESVAEVLKHV